MPGLIELKKDGEAMRRVMMMMFITICAGD